MTGTPDRTGPGPAGTPDGATRSTFRRTLVRVMLVQAVTLALLWLLQAHYS